MGYNIMVDDLPGNNQVMSVEEELNALFHSYSNQEIFSRGYVSFPEKKERLDIRFYQQQHTFWDIASIQKVVTNLALMQLEMDGLVSLDDLVKKYLSISGDFTGILTIRDLMEHRADFKINKPEYLLEDLLLAGLKFDPENNDIRIYRNSQHIILAEVLRRALDEGSLKECWEITLEEYIDFSKIFFQKDLSERGEVKIPSTRYGGLLPQDNLARYMLENGEDEPGHAGAFATPKFLWQLGEIFLPENQILLGRKYLNLVAEGGYLANEKTGLVYSYGATLRQGEFTGCQEFDREHLAFVGYSGPAVYIWPQENLLVVIMANTRFYPDPNQGNPDLLDRSDMVLEFRREVLKAILRDRGYLDWVFGRGATEGRASFFMLKSKNEKRS